MSKREYTYVKSSHVRGVYYDETQNALYVEFNNGAEYRYDGVPFNEYASLIVAPSVGGYFHQFIKDQYPASRV